MTTENDRVAFSVRLPKELCQQIDERAGISRRNRNAEIQLLLEQAIDLNVSRDLRIMEDMRKLREASVTVGSNMGDPKEVETILKG